MQFITNVKERGTNATAPDAIFFLPGWGFDGQVVALMEPARGWWYPDNFLDPKSFVNDFLGFLDDKKIKSCIVVGWSLGGYLALDFASKYPEKIKSLYLLALRKGWPPEEIEEIRGGLINDPAATMISFYRRCFLGHKKKYNEFAAHLQEDYIQRMDRDLLLRGLDYLRDASVKALPEMDTTFFHGRRDIVAPLDQMPDNSGFKVNLIENSGHVVFLSDKFMLPQELRKKALRQKFSDAASTYDEYSPVQKKVAEMLGERLPSSEKINTILELGCGTGNYTSKLVQKYVGKEITALDFSETMLSMAKQKLAAYEKIDFQCKDGEFFLYQNNGPYDLITSNATIQWFDIQAKTYLNIHELLTDKGFFLASIFGSQSLHELRAALSELFGYDKGLPSDNFPNGEMLQRDLSHFKEVETSEVSFVRQYTSMPDLLTHIKKTGTGGWLSERPPILTRNKLRLLDDWFHNKFGGYRISYQVFIVEARK